jgi:hypothetical protein
MHQREPSPSVLKKSRVLDAGEADGVSAPCREDCFDQVVRDVGRYGLVSAVECGFAERNRRSISFEVLHAVGADLEVMLKLHANVGRELIREVVGDEVREFATAHSAATFIANPLDARARVRLLKRKTYETAFGRASIAVAAC